MLRTLALVVHVAWGLFLCATLAFSEARRARREAIAQGWHRRLLKVLGVRVLAEGAPLEGPHVTASNHVSWLDIPVLGALEPTRFISKAEVRDWPIAGAFAVTAGTFFIRRGKGGAAPLLEQLIPHLRASGTVVLFPEGTTTDGAQVRPFHSRLFGAAIEAACPVQPVTIHYSLSDEGRSIAPFIGDDSLVPHLLEVLRHPGLEVRVIYGPPILPTGNRDALAEEAEDFVRSALPAPPRHAPMPLDTFPDPSRA